jgi:uncharacterized protein (TIGR03067 family)
MPVRITRTLLLSGLVLVPLANAQTPSQSAAEPKGLWTVKEIQCGGRVLRGPQVAALQVEFTGSKLIIRVGEESREAAYVLHESERPRQIDITPTTGPDAGKTFLGIYDFPGDTLRLCLRGRENLRPTEIASKLNSDLTLMVLQRK